MPPDHPPHVRQQLRALAIALGDLEVTRSFDRAAYARLLARCDELGEAAARHRLGVHKAAVRAGLARSRDVLPQPVGPVYDPVTRTMRHIGE